jgi:Bacterial Ig-like domain (group 1)
MKSLKYLAAGALLALGLVGCGGGNTLTGSTSTPTTTPAAAAISLATSAPQIASNSNVAGTPANTTVTAPISATISAVVVDKNNNAVSGATVVFAASSGVISCNAIPCVTNASGVVAATLNSGTDLADRRITVTATAGSGAGTGTVTVDVVGTGLSVTGLNQLSLGSSATYSVRFVDSNGQGIAGSVSIASALGNTAPTAVTTDIDGRAAFTVTAAIAGVDTLTLSALGTTAQASLTVISTNFSIRASASVNIGSPATITVTSLNGGSPVSGQTITFSATRGTVSSATAVTNSLGVATITLNSTAAGGSLVTASAGGVSAQTTLTFVATTPTQIAVQASPASIVTNGQSTITARLRDANNNLVANRAVNFSLVDVTGGTLGASVATTNAQGEASVVYTAGATTSAADGVVVTAYVPNTLVRNTAALTVGGQTVFLSLGTGNTVASPDVATYALTFAVLALDAQGAAVPNAPVSVEVLPVFYVKGSRTFTTSWVTNVAATCLNEDVNLNGVLEQGEDFNGDEILEPGNVASLASAVGVTDGAGELLVTVTYPKDHAGYVGVELVATASVTGTESTATSSFVLPGAAADFASQSVNPPGLVSPYGVVNDCSNPN